MNVDLDFGHADSWDQGMHERMRWLRECDPLHWSEKTSGGMWIVSRYADVSTISKSNHLFCSGEGVIPGNPAKLGLIDEDEPRHTEKRSLINRGFTPRMVRIWEDMFRAITKETLDKVAGKGECDFVEDIAVPLPLLLIADMLGIRRGDRERFHVWSDAMIGAQGNFHVPEIVLAAGKAFAEYAAYLTEVIEDRRKDPKDDLISILVGAHELGILSDFDGTPPVSQALAAIPDQQSLNKDELIMMCVLLLVAGNETTRNGLSGGMQLLIENPAERQKLIDDPSLIPDAVEEMLRLTSPVLSFCRTATQDSELHGKKIQKGQQVLMLYPSANRDSAEFDDPDSFRIDRRPHHLAFGIGNHFCLGANLARMEMRVAMLELLRRMPDMDFAAGGPEFGPSALVRSVKHMHVRYTPEVA